MLTSLAPQTHDSLHSRIKCAAFSHYWIKSAWRSIHYFFHFFSLTPLHPNQRTELNFWSQLLSLTWHLYFNLILSATSQRLNRTAVTLERDWTERNGLEAAVFLSVVRLSLHRLVIDFWAASHLRPLLSQNAHPSQKSHVDRWLYKPVICLLYRAFFHLNPQSHWENHWKSE